MSTEELILMGLAILIALILYNKVVVPFVGL